jgi:hypothetical protein
VPTRRILSHLLCVVLVLVAGIAAFGQTKDISSTPSSLTFGTTYLGTASGSKVLTINNLTTKGQVVIETVGFDCAGFGLASGVAPFTLGQTQKITHYSVFFQPTAAQSYNCNFILTLGDGTQLDVPLTATGASSNAVASVSPSSLMFANQSVGSTSTGQTVTITNTGTSNLTLNTITLSPPTFTTSAVTLPYTIAAGASLPVSVFYAPNRAVSETGALDFTFNEVPDTGSSLTGNGVAASSLAVAASTTLPQATKSSAYQATLAASGGTGPYTWTVASGSTLPSGLTLSSAGLISGTLNSSVAVGTYSFTVKVTDSTNATATGTMSLGVFASLGDNCKDISFDVPNTTTPIVALTDLGTGTYQGSEGGLYPNGSNVRPASHDADGVARAQGIQPLDSNGNYSPTGKYVLMAIGESTAQNEFNRFLPIANADPTKNPNLVIVNGAQGGATPNNFTSTTSAYWSTVLDNYLPQNGVTAKQVVAIWMEDTDGIASGTFPSDITTLQSEYETMMQTMLTLFPNLKLVYFSSRVYGGYSNGVGSPDNPEPYAYEVGFAVKWAIQDQLNGKASLNYNPNNGPVLAPWMSWGTYYWANGMLGRNDGMEWDCEDFSADGTHPSSTYGQLKVATQLLTFLKTDDTTTPWYLAQSGALAATSGNNQSGNTGSTLPTSLTVTATSGGNPVSGVTVTFSDGGEGGTFGTPSVTTGTVGTASSTYTLPSTAQTITITATSSGYSTAVFTETSTSNNLQVLTASAGNNQSGNVGTTLPTALTVTATSSGSPVSGVSVTFSDGGAGGIFGTPVAITGTNGTASSTYTLPAAAETVSITASATGYTAASFTETATSTSSVTALGVTSGGKQTGTVGTTLPLPIVITAKNSTGNVVSGAAITFTDGLGGTFSPNPAVTNSQGQASTSYTLPDLAQSLTVTASDGSVSVNASEKSVAGAATSLTIVSGNNQSANPKTTLPNKLVALVADQFNNPISGVTVTFTDNGAKGTFSTTKPVTTSSGQASVSYTTGANAGTVTISATTSTLGPLNFTETVK